MRFIDPDWRWFLEAKNVRDARAEAKRTGGEFNKWKGQNDRTYASVDYSKSANFKGDASADVKIFKQEDRSWGENVKNAAKTLQPWVKNNKTELVSEAKSLQTGDNTAIAGLAVAAVAAAGAAGAAPGLALSAYGGVHSTIGTVMEVSVELITGDFSNYKTGNAIGDVVIGKAVDNVIPGSAPGVDKVLKDGTKTFYKKTVDETKDKYNILNMIMNDILANIFFILIGTILIYWELQTKKEKKDGEYTPIDSAKAFSRIALGAVLILGGLFKIILL